ncbi:MAG: aminotransferase class V-fold PLP-dependent enzyme [Bacteroidales bacterium]
MNQTDLLILGKALKKLKQGFPEFPDTLNDENQQKIEKILLEVAGRMHNNFPYFQPHYAGQMLKPPHAVARLAYMLSLYINPNNHALDGGRESSAMEKECITGLSKMFGWDNSLGHLTSGGTFANLEALWVAGKINPEKKIVASQMAHYTHARISAVLGLGFEEIKADGKGKMDIAHLEETAKKGEIGTVVATMGTTGAGAVDPLDKILELSRKYGFRVHADAAYGGYYRLATNLSPETTNLYHLLNQVDSIVVDPHKHGLQPYGCGCILFKNPDTGRFYKHDSPYTYFSSNELHLGEISLECSRAGASAVALWATMQLMPLLPGGEMTENLNQCHRAALKLYDKIDKDDRFIGINVPELDIVVWAPKANKLSEISRYSHEIFNTAAEKFNLHLALYSYPAGLLNEKWNGIEKDAQQVTCLRSCLMKPEHLDFIDQIWEIIVSCL